MLARKQREERQEGSRKPAMLRPTVSKQAPSISACDFIKVLTTGEVAALRI